MITNAVRVLWLIPAAVIIHNIEEADADAIVGRAARAGGNAGER